MVEVPAKGAALAPCVNCKDRSQDCTCPTDGDRAPPRCVYCGDEGVDPFTSTWLPCPECQGEGEGEAPAVEE